MRAYHYLNQFFAGQGGEDRADLPPGRIEGPVGPGRLLAGSLDVVATLYCGDNFFAERPEEALQRLEALGRAGEADVLVAGPAFDAGRYGTACAHAGRLAVRSWGIPAVAAMHPDNPGVEQGRPEVFVLPAGSSAAGMAEAVGRLAALARKLGGGEAVGTPEEEGYLPRGVRQNYFHPLPAAERAVEAVLAKLGGRPYRSEIALPTYGRVKPPAALASLRSARVAVLTESGVVPQGNPDGLESARATHWFRYTLDGLGDLAAGAYQTVHGGYDNAAINADPDRAVPVDALRAAEGEGAIGCLHGQYYVTTGMATAISSAERMGREIAADLAAQGVDAAVLTAT